MPDGPVATKPELEDEQSCIDRLERLRWYGTPRCLKCGSERIARITSDPNRKDRWQCNKWRCGTTFSIRQGTIFHGSQVPLRLWFEMIRCVLQQPEKVTAAKMARHLGVTQGTSGRMLRKIRTAITEGESETLRRIVDMPVAKDQGSGIRDQGSGGSGIRDQGSGIRDQGRKMVIRCQQ